MADWTKIDIYKPLELEEVSVKPTSAKKNGKGGSGAHAATAKLVSTSNCFIELL